MTPLGHHNTKVLRCFKGTLNWAPILPRDASLLDNEGKFFSLFAKLHTEKSFPSLCKSNRNQIVFRGVAGPKKLGGTHVTLKNEYENSYRIDFLPYTAAVF